MKNTVPFYFIKIYYLILLIYYHKNVKKSSLLVLFVQRYNHQTINHSKAVIRDYERNGKCEGKVAEEWTK